MLDAESNAAGTAAVALRQQAPRAAEVDELHVRHLHDEHPTRGLRRVAERSHERSPLREIDLTFEVQVRDAIAGQALVRDKSVHSV